MRNTRLNYIIVAAVDFAFLVCNVDIMQHRCMYDFGWDIRVIRALRFVDN